MLQAPRGTPPSNRSASALKRPVGRPKGSVSLTREIHETIVSYILAGAFDHVAAESAGIPVRTFQEWMARGEGRHPTRPQTRKLKTFARDVRKAKAQARLAAEARVHQERVTYWLSHAARSSEEREGWSEPKLEKSGIDPSSPMSEDPEKLLEELEEFQKIALEEGEVIPPCPDPECPCLWHQERSFD